jgi:hypothetical protein
MKIILCVLSFLVIGPSLFAQTGRTVQLVDVTGSIGSGQGTGAASYFYNWKLGKKKRFEMGTGVRFTSYFANNRYYVTAPAKLTSGEQGPQVLFIESINENLDSVLLPKAQVNALNITFNLGYSITPRLYAGFYIDAIGFSFGARQDGRYFNGNNSSAVTAKPTGFNWLLVSDNDLGTLNSEFFIRYYIKDQWSIKAGYQFLFTEYTTDREVQTFPENNDRFRNKSSAFLLGVVYQLTSKK